MGNPYLLRQRECSKEIGPPMRYQATNEMERVDDAVEDLRGSLSDAGQVNAFLPLWPCRPRRNPATFVR